MAMIREIKMLDKETMLVTKCEKEVLRKIARIKDVKENTTGRIDNNIASFFPLHYSTCPYSTFVTVSD